MSGEKSRQELESFHDRMDREIATAREIDDLYRLSDPGPKKEKEL